MDGKKVIFPSLVEEFYELWQKINSHDLNSRNHSKKQKLSGYLHKKGWSIVEHLLFVKYHLEY
jgi:hypothetical protein